MKMFILLCLLVLPLFAFGQPSKIDFWETQQRGTNFFNSIEREERFAAAREFGIQLVRLAPNKWLNGRSPKLEGDFLLGRPNQYSGIVKEDLEYLKKILDLAHKQGAKVVVTMLSLPGARWKQHNKDVEERRLWQDQKLQEQATSFWRDLAKSLKGHPAVVGYNIRNEPSPELAEPKLSDWYTQSYEDWYKTIQGSPADLNLFYQKAVAAIREVDSETPIILDTGFYATAWGIKVMQPIADEKVIYSFHMYEPYSFNSQFNKGKYSYPGRAPLGDSNEPPELQWNKDQLRNYLKPVVEWQKKFKIPSNRIFVGEVGCFRTNQGCEIYLRDILSIFNENKWHWAFYSFREDTWAGMDYELGTEKPHWKYWEEIERGRMPDPKVVYRPNSLWNTLKKSDPGAVIKFSKGIP